MYADMARGLEGDTATVSIQSSSVDNSYSCLSIYYYQTEIDASFLSAVFVYGNESEDTVIVKKDGIEERWLVRHIPFNPGLQTVRIVVTKGSGNEGIIAIDDVDLLKKDDCVCK